MSLPMRFCLCPVVLLAGMAGAAGPRAKSDGAPPRLALVSTTLTPAIQNILTLAEAKISTDSAVQLVDRRDIDKILAEQKLSTAGFVKEDQVLRVGKLLGVNLFAVLESAPNSKEVVGLVIFDAATGTRVWDAAVPQDSLDAMTAGVRKAVQGAAAKYQQRNKGLKTVCVAAVRNAGLPPSKDAFCETIGFFLEREFVSSPSLALLERTRLDQVVKERNLPTDSPLKGLLSSLVRVELEIGPASDGKGVAATALLFDAQGKTLGKASVNMASANAVDVARALQAKALKLLEASPPAGAPDRAKEASRFVQESDFWSFLGDRPRAMRCLEAALALDPSQREYHTKLVHMYRYGAEQHLYRVLTDEDVLQSLRWMQRAVDEAVRLEASRADAKDMTEPLSLIAESYVNAFLKRVKSPLPRSQEMIADILLKDSQLVDARFQHRLAKIRDGESLAMVLASLVGPPTPLLGKGDYPPAELKSVRRKHLTVFLGLAEKFGTPLTAQQVPQIYLVIRAAASVGVAPDRIKDSRAALLRSQNPYVILYDRLVDQQIQLDGRKPAAAELPRVLAAHREFVQAQLATDASQDPLFCWHCYHTFDMLVHETMGMVFEHYADPAAKEICALADFMIERQEFQQEIAYRASQGSRLTRLRPNAERAFAYTVRLTSLLQSPECRLLGVANVDSIRNGFIANLSERRLTLLTLFPDLEPRVTPWTVPVEFMDVHGMRIGIVRVNKPIVVDNAVYAVLLGQEKEKSGHFVQLCRFALADGKKTLLGKIAVDTGYKPEQRIQPDRLRTRDSPLFVVDGLVHEGRYFVGTRDKGILIFPLNGGKVEHLHTGNGLPADHVHSLACVDGVLFAGLGEQQKPSHLVAHDLKSGRTKILASSSRVEVQSPFDNLPPWKVVQIRGDAPRQRALAYVIHGGAGTAGKPERFGLWQVDVKDGRFRQIFAEVGFDWMSSVFGDKLFVATRQNVIVDLKSDQTKSTALTKGGGQYPFVESRLPFFRELVAAGQGPRELCHGHFVHDGWLWTSNDFGRVSLDGKKKELLASPRKKSKEPFFPHESFQLVGENQILMADAHGIWLATLAKGRDSKSTSAK
jgi:hypothetical protein